MSRFRLYEALIEDKSIYTDRIEFLNEEQNMSENHITLILGNNGTGKSRILSTIARHFVDEFKGKDNYIGGIEFGYNKLPKKVIAVTNSIADKFPTDNSFRKSYSKPGEWFYRDFKYIYLGTRNKMYSFSNKALMNRALDIIFENYSELDTSRNYRHVFYYLNYEPVLKVEINLTARFVNNIKEPLKPSNLYEYLENSTSSERFRKHAHLCLEEIVGNKVDELCEFINRYQRGEKEILVNFSEKNIGRIYDDNKIYSDSVGYYNLLGILKKLNLVRNTKIKVYKRGGGEFNFSDASSGEANILSTLIALIPLIEDESLILIDEPEISLHPLWQGRYINLLKQIFERYCGCHIIIASHSHFMVTDLPPGGSSVVTLKANKKGRVTSELVEESTFGWSAEDILLNVFEMPTTRNFYFSQTIRKALELLADNEHSKDELSSQISTIEKYYPFLKDEDPLKRVASLIIKEGRYE